MSGNIVSGSRRALGLAGAAFLLWGCPQEEGHLVVGSTGDGRPVFSREDGHTDCLSGVSISRLDGPGAPRPVWDVTAPMPMPTQPPCPVALPIAYGEAQQGRPTPERAPALERGGRYLFEGEGNARYRHEFQMR